MAKISIIVGARKKQVEVDAWPFLPGLYAHLMHNGEEGLFSITHRESGLLVLGGVAEDDLELIRSVLGKVLWDKDKSEIFNDTNYYRAIQEAKLLTNHQRSEKQEKRVAKDLDGKRQPASGSRWGYRRDVVTPRFLIETKTTKADKYSVQFKDLAFIRKQAYLTGKIPVYLISLLDTSEVAILPDQDVGEDEIQSTTTATMSTQITSKSFRVTLEMVKACIDGTTFKIKHGKNQYLMVGYEAFLDFAKKGV